MIVRCRSKTGTARYDVQPTDDISFLLEKVREHGNPIAKDAPDADPDTITLSNQPRGGESLVKDISGNLTALGIKHGDLLFVSYSEIAQAASRAATAGVDAAAIAAKAQPHSNGAYANGQPASSDTSALVLGKGKGKATKKPWECVTEEPIDTYWEAHEGVIKRSRDAHMCRHGDKSMCDHCMPIEPFDPKYQAEHNIKHLSFHAYLRKLDIGTNRSTATGSNTFIPPLSEPDYRVHVPCPSGSHPNWPSGICTKCQPSAVTLALQPYRMVDHVEFASADLIENVLRFWRRTGSQRFGWMLGRYEKYDSVPMGIKAVVEAIHEPPQEGDVDGLRLGLPWEDAGRIESLADMCGLKVVGMIFTDLTPPTAEGDKGKAALSKRHKDSFFLSSLETLFAAQQQRKRPNQSRFSDSGHFSSKFVTCVITGNLQGDIAVEAYQVSNQAMALVEADMVEPSVDPGVVRIKEDTSGATDITKKRYIPDVFYTYINEYKLQVKESAKPCFPTDYLLVSLTNGFPNAPDPVFSAPAASAFPIENRQGLEDQNIQKVSTAINALAGSLPRALYADGFEIASSTVTAKGKGRQSEIDALQAVARWLSDWHLLVFLDTSGILDKTDVALMARIAIQKRSEDVEQLVRSTAWQTLVTIAAEHAPKAITDTLQGQSETGAESVPVFTYDEDGFPIIPQDHDMMRTDTPVAIPAANTSEITGNTEAISGGGEITCPHCTFANPPGTVDCEICSLPLR